MGQVRSGLRIALIPNSKGVYQLAYIMPVEDIKQMCRDRLAQGASLTATSILNTLDAHPLHDLALDKQSWMEIGGNEDDMPDPDMNLPE